MRYYYIVIFLSFFTCIANSQNASKIDSLKKELKHSKNKAEILNKIAGIYIDNSPEEAYSHATQAAEEALKQKDKLQLAHAMWIFGRYYLLINDYDKSNFYTDSARNLYHETKQQKSEINCMVMKANTLFLQADYNESLKLFKLSAKESQKIDAKGVYCSAILNIGRIYSTWGEFDSALFYFENSLSVAKEVNNKYLEGNASGFIGELYLDQNKNDLAIDYIMKALGIFESEKITAKIPYWQSMLGGAYSSIENYKESLKYFWSAMNNFKALNDRWGLEEVYSALGSVYKNMGNLDSAWIYYDISLKLSREINEKSGESNALKNIGELLLLQKQYKEALKYLNEALRLNAEFESTPGRVNLLIDIGRCYVNMGSTNKGLDLLLRGLTLADSLKLNNEKMLLHKEISAAYSNMRSFEKALNHYEAYSTLNDSIFREESNNHFIEMEQKYQAEQRQKEISQLTLEKVEQDVTIRNQRWLWISLLFGFIFAVTVGLLLFRSNKARKKANDEKEALLKEIHHRVKNNLQVISSLLSIQTQNVTDESVISAVRESQSRVKAMALIHQLLYQENELNRIDFSTYLPQLVHTVSSIFRKEGDTVDVEIEVKNISFDIDTSIPLGLIITELLSNAFKYAFDETKKGTIKIMISRVEDRNYLLTVADNGKGLPEATRIDEYTSMGLRLVKMLTGQLNGTLDYHFDKGAVFSIKFTEIL